MAVATSSVVERFVDTDTAAEFLGKPASWLYNRAERLGVPRYQIGLHYRYRLSELAAWMETTRTGAQVPAGAGSRGGRQGRRD